jgi:predicted permease
LVSVLSGLLFGLAPAFHLGRLDLTHALKQEARGSTGSGQQLRIRRVLVITEFALSLVLMVAASLLFRSFWDLLNVRLGFNPQNVMAVRTRFPEPNDPSADLYRTPAQEEPFFREVLRRVNTLPGVQEVALGDTASIPLDQGLRDLKLISEGQFFFSLEGQSPHGDQPAVADRSSVSPNYFHILGLPLLRGRFFNDSDTDKTPQVAVVNEAFARTYWPGQDPLGKRFQSTRDESPWVTVVGIIPNARTESLAIAGLPQVYLDIYQTGAKRLAILLRGQLDIASTVEQVRQQVQSVDPTLPLSGAQTLGETVSASLATRRFALQIMTLFAITALLLAGLGIYGVLSFMVSERTHEIGIRLAMGAQSRNILRMVVGQGLRLAVAGAVAGLAVALVVSQLMAGLLFGVRPSDPLTFSAVAILLIVVALLACYLPARRAVRVDPLIALRHD